MSNSLESLNNSLFQTINAEEAAMVLGGLATSNTFIEKADGTLTYIGQDTIIKEPVAPSNPGTVA